MSHQGSSFALPFWIASMSVHTYNGVTALHSAQGPLCSIVAVAPKYYGWV